MASGLYSFFHTGAFNAFDKDGSGIIKLNVLEVKPARSSTLALYLKIQGGVNEADWPSVLFTSQGCGRMGEERNRKGSTVGDVAHGECTHQRVLIPKMTLCWKTCTFPGEIWGRLLLLPIKSAQGEPFPYPVRPLGLDSVLLCILILGLPLSVAAAHHVCLNQAGLSQGRAGSLRICLTQYS